MLFSFRVSILFGHTEIYHIYSVGRLVARTTNEEIIGFYISIDEILLMYSLDSGDLVTSVEKP
jgi:hypothetical protein